MLPGPALDGASLHQLIVEHGVTLSNGVPTVWAGLLQHLAAQGGGLGRLRKLVIGGSACPPAMIESFAQQGVEVLHAWGMTELSPIGIAMGTGTDVTMKSTQITLIKGDLRGIARARELSAATVANMRQNPAFAFLYNALGVPIAGGRRLQAGYAAYSA